MNMSFIRCLKSPCPPPQREERGEYITLPSGGGHPPFPEMGSPPPIGPRRDPPFFSSSPSVRKHPPPPTPWPTDTGSFGDAPGALQGSRCRREGEGTLRGAPQGGLGGGGVSHLLEHVSTILFLSCFSVQVWLLKTFYPWRAGGGFRALQRISVSLRSSPSSLSRFANRHMAMGQNPVVNIPIPGTKTVLTHSHTLLWFHSEVSGLTKRCGKLKQAEPLVANPGSLVDILASN